MSEDVEADLATAVEGDRSTQVVLPSGESVAVDVPTANVLLTVLRALTDENKQKMIDLMKSSVKNFMKVVKFSWENVENDDSEI